MAAIISDAAKNAAKKIRALPENVWTQIAAGEVVERPASAVKELIENSLDASARNIKVRLRDGGRLSITVEDDGCGIAFDDLPLALTPHATSKIQDIHDLEGIYTLGYRGEALASLAAVSEIEIRSRIKDSDQTGGMIRARDGQVIDHLSAPCVPGTRVYVENIFEQMPARRKFLKSARSELSRVASCLREYSVARPDVRFVLENDNKIILQSDGLGDRVKILAQFWGVNLSTSPDEIQYARSKYGNLSLDCWWQSRPGRSDVMAFVNGRAVNDPTIRTAVSVVARELAGNWALFFTLNPALVDVNIHPAKTEVRFKNTDEIYKALYYIARHLGQPGHLQVASQAEDRAVSSINTPVAVPNLTASVQVMAAEDRAVSSFNVPAAVPNTKAPVRVMASKTERGWDLGSIASSSLTSRTVRSSRSRPKVHAFASASADTNDFADVTSKINAEPVASASSDTLTLIPESKPDPGPVKFLGQTASGYLVFDDNDSLMLIDPHAAHERVNYEKIKRAAESNNSQGLLVPVVLPPTLALEALEYRELLASVGFTFEEKEGSVILKSVPTLPDSAPEPESLLRSSLAVLKSCGDDQSLVSSQLWRTWATMACKASVKLTTTLTPQEAYSLSRELLSCEQPYFCPHGRPTLLKITTQDIARHFQRE